jgi:hypothetical protein
MLEVSSFPESPLDTFADVLRAYYLDRENLSFLFHVAAKSYFYRRTKECGIKLKLEQPVATARFFRVGCSLDTSLEDPSDEAALSTWCNYHRADLRALVEDVLLTAKRGNTIALTEPIATNIQMSGPALVTFLMTVRCL